MQTRNMHSDKIVEKSPNEQAVLIFLQFSMGKFSNERAFDAILALEEILREEIEFEQLGQLENNEISEDAVTFFIYGISADAIADRVLPILSTIPCISGSYILKQYDDKEGREEQIFIA